MGRNKGITKRGWNASNLDVRQLVISWIKLLEYGLVDFPRDIRMYHRSIIKAFNGDFEGTEQAILNCVNRLKQYKFEATDDIRITKWKESTSTAWQRTIFLLELTNDLLKEYHGQPSNTIDKTRKATGNTKHRSCS